MKRLELPRAFLGAIAFAAILAGCGGDDSGGAGGAAPTVAETSHVSADTPVAGVTPFISFVQLHGVDTSHLVSVRFSIVKRPGSFSKPVSVGYSRDHLVAQGNAVPGGTDVRLPVFGLYAGFANLVNVEMTYDDNSTGSLLLTVTTAPYVDPHATYDRPQVIQARATGSQLGFDFLYMKSGAGTPVVIDTDGALRWVGTGVDNSTSSTFTDNGFEIGEQLSPKMIRLELDGTVAAPIALDVADATNFHHNLEIGKSGLIGNIDSFDDGVDNLESVAVEFAPDGSVFSTWDMAAIISEEMSAAGDDPTAFVRPGVDWFHMNTAIYDPRDDSMLVSSRENFIVKLDYTTKQIRWIFGDTTKYWYTFASLRAKSLQFLGDGLVPIGQHSLTIAPDGNLLLFNNGRGSANEPTGTSAGVSRTYAAVSSYVIDETNRTATEQWHFDHDMTYSSPSCSSAEQYADGSLLVDYAIDPSGAHVVGLDASRTVVFDYQYANTGCTTSWHARAIPFEAMQFD